MAKNNMEQSVFGLDDSTWEPKQPKAEQMSMSFNPSGTGKFISPIDMPLQESKIEEPLEEEKS